ncbi:hypothetical protein RCO48_05450 [Peribacillus frigoritolerans]|nr:hypothetical protein [Peribacillus frigoritolerans]
MENWHHLCRSAALFSTYATRFIDPALGFALGWNYWFTWAMTLAAELSAATMVMKFWFPDSSSFFMEFFVFSFDILIELRIR